MAIEKIPNPLNYTVPRGKLLFQQGEVYTGKYRELGVGSQFNMALALEFLEHFDLSIGGNLKDAKILTKKEAKGSLILDEPNLLNLEHLFLGSDSQERTQVAALSVDAEELNAGLDLYVPILKTSNRVYKISNVVVKDVTDTTTYIEGDDYEIDYEHGLIRVLSGGSGGIVEDAVLHVTFDNPDVNEQYFKGFVKNTVEGYFLFLGNPTRGRRQEVEGYASLYPTGDHQFIIDNAWQLCNFEIEFLTNDKYKNANGEGLFDYRDIGLVTQ